MFIPYHPSKPAKIRFPAAGINGRNVLADFFHYPESRYEWSPARKFGHAVCAGGPASHRHGHSSYSGLNARLGITSFQHGFHVRCGSSQFGRRSLCRNVMPTAAKGCPGCPRSFRTLPHRLFRLRAHRLRVLLGYHHGEPRTGCRIREAPPSATVVNVRRSDVLAR